MSVSEIAKVSFEVIKNPKVIICAVVVFLYMDICAKVVRYKKKPIRRKSRGTVPEPVAQAAESGENSEGGGEE